MVDYYSEVVSWGRVDKLIYLNFLPLLLNIDRQSLLSDFSSLIVEKYAIDLLSAFLYRPILDINGKVQRNWWNTNVLLFTEQFAQQSCHASL